MYERGIFTKKHEGFIADLLADKIHFKNAILEKFKKRIFRFAIRMIDNFGFDRLKEAWKQELLPIVDAAVDGNVEKVRLYVNDLLNKKIDLPNMDEGRELELIDHQTKTFAIAIENYLLKNKSQL